MEEICEIKDLACLQNEALGTANEERSVKDFDNTLKATLDELKSRNKFQASKTTEFKEFKKRLGDMATLNLGAAANANASSSSGAGRMESDDVVMESAINIIDPLTKLRMKDPVRNKICGHHYDKSTILESIKINKRLRCPVAGCGHKQFVKADDLVDDHVMRLRILQLAETESMGPLNV